MVSLRCKMVVKKECNNLGLSPIRIDLGIIELTDAISDDTREELSKNLSKYGLELIDDHPSILVEQIKASIIELVLNLEEFPTINYSEYLSDKLNYDYKYLSNLFSKTKGVTIQEFIVISKVERVKELLMYGEMNLTDIAYLLNYNSVAHLSNQFKKVTGLCPSFFKQSNLKRTSLGVI